MLGHLGLLYKLKRALPTDYYLILKSYLSHRYFQTKINSETSSYHPIQAGVLQGSVLGPILYLIFTADIPTTSNTEIATYADDTALLALTEDPQVASEHLQYHLNLLQIWTERWRIKVNELKSAQFTNRQVNCPAVTFNDTPLPTVNEVKSRLNPGPKTNMESAHFSKENANQLEAAPNVLADRS
jgi:hypothetical protein